MSVKPIPDGYHSITPYLVVKGAVQALDFYKRALGASELFRMEDPKGRIGHAELQIGNSRIMLADEHPELGHFGPQRPGGAAVSLLVYVDDVDRVFKQALAAGAKQRTAVANQFYGDRSGTLEDPYGHVWTLATHIEDVAPEEMDRRVKQLYAGAS
jgi:PhnB protein